MSKEEAAQKLADDLERVRLLEERERKNSIELDQARIQLEQSMRNLRIAYWK